MDSDPGSRDVEESSAAQGASADAQSASQVMLAEYSALRSEVDRRANVQWNVIALQITSAGVIASLAISRVADIALLLVIPLLSYMLGTRYILNAYHINLITSYIRYSLSVRLQGHLAWEGWKADKMKAEVEPRYWLTATGWNWSHPTRLAFEGVASLALLAAVFAAAYAWRDKAPAWDLILGFALLWILGALATYRLDRLFNETSAPTVTEISPTSGPVAGGEHVTVTGTGFTGASKVSFGTVPASNLAVASDTQLSVTSPQAAAAGPVRVTVTIPGTSAASPANQYTYAAAAAAPTVTGVSPTSGPVAGGEHVTVTGTGFTGASKVSFGTVPGSNLAVASDTQLSVTSPQAAAAGPVDVTVTTPAGTSAASQADQYTYT
jgi:IPT/TIG domain